MKTLSILFLFSSIVSFTSCKKEGLYTDGAKIEGFTHILINSQQYYHLFVMAQSN